MTRFVICEDLLECVYAKYEYTRDLRYKHVADRIRANMFYLRRKPEYNTHTYAAKLTTILMKLVNEIDEDREKN